MRSRSRDDHGEGGAAALPLIAPPRDLVRRWPLAAYFALAYLITWSLLAPLALAARGESAFRVPAAWHALGALGPFAAALVVTWTVGGSPAVRDWLRGFARWRVGARWWLLAVASPFALFVVAALLVHAGGVPWPDFARLARPPYASAAWLSDVLFVGTVAYGLGEEPGWRGFALPRLEARYGPLVGTLILTPIWAGWHFPAFFYRASYQGGLPTVVGFLFGLLAGAIVLTFLYDGTRGSLLLVVLFHVLINVAMQVAAVLSASVVAAMSVLTAIGAIAIAAYWIARSRRRPSLSGAPG